MVRQVILWTGMMAVIPLITYPEHYGLGMLGFHPVVSLIEWALYLGIYWLTLPSLTFSQRVLAGGFTVVYRLWCAALFAGLVSLSKGVSWMDTAAIAMWSYPYSVLPHILLAPLALHGVWQQAWIGRPRRITGFHSPAAPARKSWAPVAAGAAPSRHRATVLAPRAVVVTDGGRTFDDAMHYIGEYSGVRMCWLVDKEGLTISCWQRQDYPGALEFWAPVSVEMVEFDRRWLSVGGEVNPQRMEVRTDGGRLIVEAAGHLWLGVLTDRDADELIGVRLSQARDMVIKNLQERRMHSAGLQEAHYV